MQVADATIEILSRYGVRHVFGMPGDAINDFTYAIRKRDDMEFILVRHEEAGAIAASAQAKLNGGLSCCMGTSGGGAIHLLNGLYDAKHDHAPVLAITGQVPTQFVGTNYHQEVDLERLFEDVCVYSKAVMDEDQLPLVLMEACRAALSERAPAHVNIPTNIAGKKITRALNGIRTEVATGETQPCQDSMERAAELANEYSKIVILMGIGAANAVGEVVALSNRIKAPIIRTLRAKDCIDDDHPNCIGGAGLLGGRPAMDALESCELLIIVGADFPYVDFYPKNAKVVQIDPDPRQIGKRIWVDAPLQGHAAATIRSLLKQIDQKDDDSFHNNALASAEKQRQEWQKQEASTAYPIKPQHLMAEITRLAPDDSIYLCDTGTATAWTARHLSVQSGQRYTLSSGLGTMAFALPGAIGAQLAYPDRKVIAIAGDGAFAMLMADFVTAVRYNLPITVVVLDNASLAFIAMEQEAKGLPEHSIDLVNPDFVAFANACGGEGFRIEKAEELKDGLSAAILNGQPTVVSVAVSPDELILPPRITFDQAYNFGLAKIREAIN